MSIHRLVLLLLVPFTVHAQPLGSADALPRPTGAASRSTAVAIRLTASPPLDARDDTPVWRSAQLIEGFREFQPVEDGEERFRTEARVAYDAKYLYVMVRAFDPHPDSIVSLLSRRDVRTPSDQLKIMIDSYHDRRTGYEFAVNPIGVKRDFYTFNDAEEDPSWDAVWDVATRVDSLGWVAQFRIPFSQLRFPKSDEHTFGLMIWREIARTNERMSWPAFHRSQPGIASQFGEITGIRGLESARRLEIMPYAVGKSSTPPDAGYTAKQSVTGGADIKYGVTSNLTLDATVNPDFGQVEADPAVLNLSAFETFFPERRPFFVEGSGIFRFDLGCAGGGGCSSLFYSRRIGRTPQLIDDNPLTPNNTTILGAAKLTGRLPSGLSLGIIDGVTDNERSPTGEMVEPQSNYFAARAQRDFRGGLSGIGLMVTSVTRNLTEQVAQDSLRRTGLTAGLDFRHRFDGGEYELSGFIAGSRVTGSEAAIALTQANSTHYYQRPGSGAGYDPTRTELLGDAAQLAFGKVGGGILRFRTELSRISPGFEPNDLGFLTRADVQSQKNYVGFVFNTPTSLFRQAFVDLNEAQHWNTGGLDGAHLSDVSFTYQGHMELQNSWWGHLGGSVNNFVPVYDDHDARGGPAVRRSMWGDLNALIEGDPRRRVSPSLGVFGFRGSGGRSFGWGLDPLLQVRLSGSFTASIGPHFDRNDDDHQWIGNFDHRTDPASTRLDTSYTFAHLHQSTIAMTTRVDLTLTPTLSLQLYAQPFVSNGKYRNWRELNDVRNADYDLRYKAYAPPDTAVNTYDFNDFEFRSNTVLRWEYRPGSSIFFVWAQGRTLLDEGVGNGAFDFRGNIRDLFALHPGNTFLVKMSYWFSP